MNSIPIKDFIDSFTCIICKKSTNDNLAKNGMVYCPCRNYSKSYFDGRLLNMQQEIVPLYRIYIASVGPTWENYALFFIFFHNITAPGKILLTLRNNIPDCLFTKSKEEIV